MKSKKTFRLNVLLLVNLLLFNPIIIHPSNAESFPVIYFGLFFPAILISIIYSRLTIKSAPAFLPNTNFKMTGIPVIFLPIIHAWYTLRPVLNNRAFEFTHHHHYFVKPLKSWDILYLTVQNFLIASFYSGFLCSQNGPP